MFYTQIVAYFYDQLRTCNIDNHYAQVEYTDVHVLAYRTMQHKKLRIV